MLRSLLALASLLASALGASAQALLVVESTNKRVLLLDEFDGSLLDPIFIDLSVAGANTPIQAQEVGREIWITDQVADAIFRFSLDGQNHLGTIRAGLNNIRGFEVAGDTVYVSNAGTQNGAPGPSLVTFDLAGTLTGSFPVDDPFDVFEQGGALLVSNIADDDIDRYDLVGNFLGKFHQTSGSGISFPEQISAGAGGNVLVAGFNFPSGIYEYDPSGNQVQYHDTVAIGGQSGLRGVWRLGNGKLLYTNSSGVHALDPVQPSSITILGGVSGRFIGRRVGGQASLAFCFGDGSGNPCPCGNTGASGRGCDNGTGSGGARLSGSGSPGLAAADLVLSGSGLEPNALGLYFQGDNALAGGLGMPFGDGLRCVGGGVVRIQLVHSNAQGDSGTSVAIGAVGGAAPGEIKRYQLWYRNQTSGLCGTFFNLTNGVEVTWQP